MDVDELISELRHAERWRLDALRQLIESSNRVTLLEGKISECYARMEVA